MTAEGNTRTMDIRTTTVGPAGDRREIVFDSGRCYGYLRRWGKTWKAWRSGGRTDNVDDYLGEFNTRQEAVNRVTMAGNV